MIQKFVKVSLASLLFSSCAILYHVQLGSIDSRSDKDVLIPFEIKVSEMGVSTEEVGRIARASGGNGDAGKAAAILQLFQLGPTTGNPVYDESYAKKLVYEIHQKCPTGRVTGLVSIREMRKYPVISGEIVKVTGFCMKAKLEGKNI